MTERDREYSPEVATSTRLGGQDVQMYLEREVLSDVGAFVRAFSALGAVSNSHGLRLLALRVLTSLCTFGDTARAEAAGEAHPHSETLRLTT